MERTSIHRRGIDKIWKPFFLSISLIIALFLGGVFTVLIVRTNNLIQDQMLNSGRAHFRNIVLTRRWNANYHGVFVLKTNGVESNPYIENPDIESVDRLIYTIKNPALMTREISEYAKEDGDYVFHITSLKLLNPNNRPDEFEREALAEFAGGLDEVGRLEEYGPKLRYRYMAPLLVEESCLACHAFQGYKVGDVLGGISVSFDVTSLMRKLRINEILVVVLNFAATGMLLTLIYLLVLRFRAQLKSAYDAIETMSITDELTGVYNRRHFMVRLSEEGAKAQRYQRPLSLMLLDLDYFKNINDVHGHQAGDAVLKQAAQIAKTNCRNSDLVARYGGEEFVVVQSETSLEGSETAAEKIRRAMESHVFDLGNGKEIKVTASIGVACFSPQYNPTDDLAEWLIGHADEALYKAKADGRNRVVVSRDESHA